MTTLRAHDNPFRTEKTDTLPFVSHDITMAAIMDRLQALRYRAAIVGPQGSGKTTLVLDLSAALLAVGFEVRTVLLNEANPTLPVLPQPNSRRPSIWIIDGAEVLSVLQWTMLRWKARNAAGLITTQHSPGRLPTLIQTRTSVALLATLVDRLAPGHVSPEVLDQAYRLHQGNLRDALRWLYDRAATGVTAYAAS